MSKPTNVLIVEHEPLITHTIKDALHHISNSDVKLNFTTKSIENLDIAYSEIKQSNQLHLIFLNIDMYSNNEKFELINDMINTLKNNSPKSKLLTMTSNQDNYMVIDIFKTLNPECILLKQDISFKDLMNATESVINNIPFYSKTILRLLRTRMSCDFSLDKKDRLILYHLSKGIKTKDLVELAFLSKSGIETRKRNLKIRFNVENKNDTYLLEQARIKGFI